MYLIVGLGNPEPEYSKTRHNMGFDVINKIAQKYKIEICKSKFKGLYGTGTIEGEKVILLKPQTFMNLSGDSVSELVNFYKIEKNHIIVVFDDIDTVPGKIRIKRAGSAGTHNGMKSVIKMLGTEEFARIRVGIGSPEYKNDLINYVIGKISDDEYKNLEKGIELAINAVEEIIKNDVDLAMNKYN